MSNRIIKINRGDSFEFTITINEKYDIDKKHLLTANEAVYFALIHPNKRFEDAVILQGYDHTDQDDKGNITVKITPNATRMLTPGIYYYTVKLQRGGTLDVIGDFDNPDEVRTLIERTKFIINE